MKLTQTMIKKLFNYNSLTGDLIWRVSYGNHILVGDIAGSKSELGYISTGINGKLFYNHRLVWLYHFGYLPEYLLDHRDQDKSNNRLANLREVSKQCNARNSGNRKNNTSGVKGVHEDKKYGKWIAQITINNKSIYLGYCQNFDEAVCLRLAAEQSVGWAGCDASSPAYKYVRKEIQEVIR